MTKQISIVALIISVCAAICGLFFVCADEMIYEWQNGPPLVTPDFGKKVKIAYDKDPLSMKDLGLDYTTFDFRFRYKALNDVESIIEASYDDQGAYNVYEKYLAPWVNQANGERVGFREHSVKSGDELNKLIDKYIFPDSKTRKQKKQAILDRINELNGKPKTSAKVKATVNWKQFRLN